MTPIDPADLGRKLGARAAGAWSVRGDHLEQLGFWAAPDMPAEVAEGFAAATVRVPMDQIALAIVAVAVEGRPRESVAADLPADAGSGYWLRRFGAARSLAMPVFRGDRVDRVVSVAIADADRPAPEVFAAMRSLLGRS